MKIINCSYVILKSLQESLFLDVNSFNPIRILKVIKLARAGLAY